MKPIRILTHVACKPPGYLAVLLSRLGLTYEQVCLFSDRHRLDGMENARALVFMGGPGDVNRPTGWMLEELALIQRAAERNVPMLGVCLGAQLICKALGGSVSPAQSMEVGWHPVQLTRAASDHPGFSSLPQSFEVFHWHQHVCHPPEQARVVASSACSQCQGFVLGQHLAVQFHLELGAQTIRDLIELYPSDLDPVSRCVQSADEVLREIDRRTANAYAIADKLFAPWFEAL